MIAIKYSETHTIAECMNHFLGEFFEGCGEEMCETARLRFNYCWTFLSKEQKQAVLDACPFEKWANEFADKKGLEKPYVEDGVGKYGVIRWKRVREDPTELGAMKALDEFVDTLWKRARKNCENK